MQKSMKYFATSTMHEPSSITIMPPEPMIEPALARDSYSTGMSRVSVGRHPPDGPPVCTALNSFPSGMPPPMSKTISRKVIPIGTSTRPVFRTRPASAKTLVPLLFSVPICACQSPPLRKIGGTFATDADLVVMGTTSRHGLNSFVFGSCAEEVIHHAKCPVVTLGPKVKKEARAGFHLGRVVFATDLNHHAVEKVSLALAFAQESLAKVYLCSVLDSAGTDLSDSIYRQLDAEAELRKLVPDTTYEWCSPEFIVEFGNVAERIIALAKRTEADLIVLGARQSVTHFTRVAKGVVEHVLAEATCPVMTICAD